MLHDPFYVGVIRIRRTGDTFSGVHPPIVPVHLFKRVQDILAGKSGAKVQAHDFLYRRLFTCQRCGRTITGECQKGIVYYRCHTHGCTGTSVREDAIEVAIANELKQIELRDDEYQNWCGALKA